ncbi:helix-turn-helix domain-containing protein [Sinorhizobium meliloti]|uniref:helix-turn-helix domain-containing protein n=1 Tax=Rhizobium meliloti TaxID=382 RepID=UPI000FDA793B|nr:hypothetical protein [Sinorhizobium meliloti]QGJ73832.1 hypothetical protein C3L21_07310 [Sinorhizobium meliloti]RVG89009.1 hypothetical protein CN218_25995 [Sinorhizobium meliloti]RVK90473.1 hypothetical protein CN150_27735 [Sinorhizobium meliloti]RVL60708.1 hypothetical protein CN137_18070 [Sinorhizobium meliloti]
MTAEEFKQAIERLGYSQVGISRLFGVTDRTGRRWASGQIPVPEAAELCLNMMLMSGLTPQVMGVITARRVGDEFGDRDEIQYRWVLPKHEGAEWTVARYFLSSQTFELPGTVEKFSLGEVHFGPRVYPPATS